MRRKPGSTVPSTLLDICAPPIDLHRTDSTSFARVNAPALPHKVVVIRWKIGKDFDKPAGPTNYELRRLFRLTQSEMQSKVALRDVAISTTHLLVALIVPLLQG